MSPINPPAPPPPIQKRAMQTARNLAYRYRRAITVGLFGAVYIVGIALADAHVAVMFAIAYVLGAAVHTIVSGGK